MPEMFRNLPISNPEPPTRLQRALRIIAAIVMIAAMMVIFIKPLQDFLFR